MEPSRTQQMTTQIEFYMSDKNLKTDKFFHNLISSSRDQLISLNVLLNCKKIKQMKPSLRELETAIQASKLLVLSPDKTSFRRSKKNLPLLKEKVVKIMMVDKPDLSQVQIPEGEILFIPALLKFSKEEWVKKNEEAEKSRLITCECKG